MDSSQIAMIFAFIVLISLSALFSMSETAFMSINKIRVKTLAEENNKKAILIQSLLENQTRLLSSVLVGNNLVNIAASSLTTSFVISLLGNDGTGVAIATGVVTLVILIFGEILPKSFAKDHSETFSLAVAAPLSFIRTILTPVVWIFIQIKRLFTGRNSGMNLQPSVTEDELKTIIDTVEEEGVLSEQETDIIQSAIDFDNTTVQEILVPRVDMVAVEMNTPTEDILSTCLDNGYSRIPVYQNSIDNIVGVLHAKDLLNCLAKNKPIVVSELMRDVMFVYRTKRINSLLADFRRTKQHIAIVTDDYGGTVGLVTLEDVLEELVGEIWDETDSAEVPIRAISENKWEVQGDVNIEDLFETIGFSDRNFDCDYSSVAGWVLDVLEHIPVAGEHFGYKNLRIVVQKVEDQRILSLLVEREDLPEESPDF